MYLNGKKVCGILSEAMIDFESGMSDAMIIGIGVNVTTSRDDFPVELQSIATSCGQVDCSRNQLIAEIASELFALYEKDERAALLSEYRSLSYVLYKQITYTYQKQTYTGYALDINDLGHLIIEHDGEIIELHSGEVKEVRVNEQCKAN